MSYEVLYCYCQIYKYHFDVSVIYSSFYYCCNFELLLHYVIERENTGVLYRCSASVAPPDALHFDSPREELP